MNRPGNFCEYNFLDLFYQEMLAKGRPHNLIRLSVDPKMVKDIYDNLTISLTENYLQEMADICLANSWVEHSYMGGGQYDGLQLTLAGLGIARSKRKQAEQLNNRNSFKKASDYIEEHKGLFILLGSIIALAGLLIKNGSSGDGK